jgi:hypothetical protein
MFTIREKSNKLAPFLRRRGKVKHLFGLSVRHAKITASVLARRNNNQGPKMPVTSRGIPVCLEKASFSVQQQFIQLNLYIAIIRSPSPIILRGRNVFDILTVSTTSPLFWYFLSSWSQKHHYLSATTSPCVNLLVFLYSKHKNELVSACFSVFMGYCDLDC